jgi:ribosomal protein S18 acetylase RimI-like enzyme
MTRGREPADAASSSIGEVTIRGADLADAAGIATVQTVSWRETYAGLVPADFLAQREVHPQIWVERLDMARRDGSRTAILVAAVGREVVGFCAVGPDGGSAAGRLYAIYLRKAWQQRGIGHELHRRGVRFLAAAGFDRAVLDVLDTNAPAIDFYSREGWTATGELRTDQSLGIALREQEYELPLPNHPGERGDSWSGLERFLRDR